MSIFPLKKGSTIIRCFMLDGNELIEESRFYAYRTFEELESWLDVWDEDTTRFLLIDPREGTVKDVTDDLAVELLWHAVRSGHVNKYDPDWDRFPTWARDNKRFQDELPHAIEEFNAPEPYETERLRKPDLL